MTSNTLTQHLLHLRTLSCLVVILVTAFQILPAQHSVDAAFNSPHNGKIYMFRGDEYIRIDSATLNCDTGYPRNISTGWGVNFPAGWEADWDAITPRNNGTTVCLIFKGNRFLEWNIIQGTFNGPYGYNAFPNLPASFGNVTAAYASTFSDGFWIFDEDEYVFIDAYNYTSSSNVTLANEYGTLYPENFKHIDASFAQPHNNQVFYIRGTQEADLDLSATPLSYTVADLPSRFTNWPFTDAVKPFANGECELDVQFSDAKCSDQQEFPVVVDNLNLGTNTLGVDTRLASVELHALHPHLADLDIFLTSPAGITVTLSEDNGGSNDDYGSSCLAPTVFTMTADTVINNGTPPYTGTYRPEGDFADFLNGTSAEGNWTLKICDDGPADFGTLEYVKLNFVAFTPVGIDDHKLAGELTIFPNPSNGHFQLSLPEGQAVGMLSIFDLHGRQVYAKQVDTPQVQLNLEETPAGVYMLRFESTAGKFATQRLTITH